MKKSVWSFISYVFFPLCGLIALWLYFLFTPVITDSRGMVYDLRPGTSKSLAIQELSAQKIIKHPVPFFLYAYLKFNSHLKTGEYLFPKGSTAVSIWEQITQGRGLFYRPFTIIPGWTFSQLRHALIIAPGLKHLTIGLSDQQIMQRLGARTLQAEGEFFPETYYYTKGNIDLVMLKRAYVLMQTRLIEAWDQRAPSLPYKNIDEALIVASLVEKEAHLNSERSLIAGVIINRLNKNMLLQIDPTVIYGMGTRYTGTVHKKDLLEDTAYNTYVHKGLPPTPIAIPSIASLEAALHPAQHDYYYFVAKGDGSHQFSKTLVEHHTAVSTFIKQPSS